MSFNNVYNKRPETVWPISLYLVMQDGEGNAIDWPDDLRSETHGVVREAPVVGDVIVIRVGDAFEDWRVVSRRWMHMFPVDGQMTPCSALEVAIVKAVAGQVGPRPTEETT